MRKQNMNLPSGQDALKTIDNMSCRLGYYIAQRLEVRHYRLESLNTELADIEKKISKETQLDRKDALAKEKQRIEGVALLCGA